MFAVFRRRVVFNCKTFLDIVLRSTLLMVCCLAAHVDAHVYELNYRYISLFDDHNHSFLGLFINNTYAKK